jgi:hypothetical protein
MSLPAQRQQGQKQSKQCLVFSSIKSPMAERLLNIFLLLTYLRLKEL